MPKNYGTIQWEGKTLTLKTVAMLDNGWLESDGKPVWVVRAFDADGREYVVEYEYCPEGYSDEEVGSMIPDYSRLGRWDKPMKVIPTF